MVSVVVTAAKERIGEEKETEKEEPEPADLGNKKQQFLYPSQSS